MSDLTNFHKSFGILYHFLKIYIYIFHLQEVINTLQISFG